MTSVLSRRVQRSLPQKLGASELHRRLIVRGTFFIFYLLLAEGPLRKWFLPGAAGILALLPDPFALLLYAYCAKKRPIWTGGVTKVWLFFAGFSSIFGLIQYIGNDYSVAGWILGVRAYWMYMPLGFIIAATYREEDILRFFRAVLFISIPYAILVVLQYKSPPFAFINWGVAADVNGAVGLEGSVVRVFGLFTYTAPNVLYTAFSLSTLLGYYLASKKGSKQFDLLVFVAAFSVGSMSVLTGSRSIYFIAGVIICFTFFGLIVSRVTKHIFRKIFGILVFILLSGILYVYAFPDMLAAMSERFTQAATIEGGLGNRIYYSSFSFLSPRPDTGALGFGIGAGSPGVAHFMHLPPLVFGESDTQRNINELGLVLGPLFLLLRFGTAIWLGSAAFRSARRNRYFALPFAGFAIFVLVFGALTNSTTQAMLDWIAIGIVIAARKSINVEPHYNSFRP